MIDVLCSNFVKFGRRESVKSRIAYRTKPFRQTLQLSLLRRSRPKSAMASPNNVLRESAPDFIEIGSLSAEL